MVWTRKSNFVFLVAVALFLIGLALGYTAPIQDFTKSIGNFVGYLSLLSAMIGGLMRQSENKSLEEAREQNRQRNRSQLQNH